VYFKISSNDFQLLHILQNERDCIEINGIAATLLSFESVILGKKISNQNNFLLCKTIMFRKKKPFMLQDFRAKN
jgi:hypothetical protein